MDICIKESVCVFSTHMTHLFNLISNDLCEINLCKQNPASIISIHIHRVQLNLIFYAFFRHKLIVLAQDYAGGPPRLNIYYQTTIRIPDPFEGNRSNCKVVVVSLPNSQLAYRIRRPAPERPLLALSVYRTEWKLDQNSVKT